MACCGELNCFGRPRTATAGSLFGVELGGQGKSNDPQSALRDISERPSVIDYDLETTVWKWEAAINEYREYEADVFSANDDTSHEILGLLEALRAKPATFFDSDIEKLRNLALKRAKIYKWQYRLGLADNDAPMDGGGDDIPAPLTSAGLSPLHNSGVRRLETSFSASQSGRTSFSVSALNLSKATEESKDIVVPPDPLLFNSLRTLQSLSKNEEFKENRKSAMVRLAGKSESKRVDKTPLSTPSIRPVQLDSRRSTSTTSGSLSLSIRGERPSLRESLMTPRRSMQLSGQLRGSLKGSPSSVRDDDISESEFEEDREEDISVTRVLSLTWAGRLNEVNSTQGTFQIQSTTKAGSNADSGRRGTLREGDSSGTRLQPGENDYSEVESSYATATVSVATNSEVPAAGHHIHRIKPKWPAFLQEVWYDVVKWNNFGARQRRIIKLTEYCIMNIKDGKKITKMYYYMNIARIWIESSAMFKIVLKDGTKLCYISEMAPTIVQQITTRVQVRIALEKTTFSSMPVSPDSSEIIGPEYSQEAAHKLIEAINADHEEEASGVMQNFAMNLMNTIPVYGNRGKSAEKKQGISSDDKGKSRATRMINKSEHSPEYLVQTKIEEVIFDDRTDEGNTRKVFLNEFDSSKTLVSVRHFIDGLHEYLLTARGVQLALLYSSKDSKEDIREGSLSRGSSALSITGRPSNKLRSSNISIRGIGSMTNLELVGEESLAVISFLTFSVIEESIYLPLKDTINEMLPSSNSGMDEALRRKVKQLKDRSQLEWNVPEEYVSPMGWNSAIFELTGLDRASTPSASITTLVRCCKAIYAEFKHSVLPTLGRSTGAAGPQAAYLGADDLVPIFVYVFCKAGLKTPHKYKDLMWNLCHPDQLHGECGYYLTVFESAIEYVEIEPVERPIDTGMGSSRSQEGEIDNYGRTRATTNGSSAMGDGDGAGRDRTVTTSADSKRGSIFSLALFDSSGNGISGKEGTRKRKESIYDQTMNMTGFASKKTNEATFHEEGDEDGL